MKDYYIKSIVQEDATPLVLAHMTETGTIYDEAWSQDSANFVQWFGAFYMGGVEGVIGLMMCSSMPDDLIIVGLYGTPHAIKILGDYALRYPQKNKFGYVDINNQSWMLALMKRGFEVSPIVEHDAVGNKVRLVQLTGGQHAR
jgi:hypothetical protein